MKWIVGIVLVGIAALVGCGGEEVCAPGLQQSCACPGAELGAQACNEEGTGFEECICSPQMSGGNGGGSCAATCEEAKQCEGADPSIDCEEQCAQGKADATSLGCPVEYEDLVACSIAMEDVCNPGEQCSAEVDAFADCFVDGCTVDPEDPVCNWEQ